MAGRRVSVAGVEFDLVSRAEVAAAVARALRDGEGGVIVTPNVDICRKASRDRAALELIRSATLVVPDGVPLLWAARLAGAPLAGRITGSDLVEDLVARAAECGWPVCLLGGLPGAAGRPGTAELAGARLSRRFAGLAVTLAHSPPERFDPVTADLRSVGIALAAAAPKLVFVGLGFPKQEQLIARLRRDLPGAWFVACGAALRFAAGTVPRAPAWMRGCGLEWLFRLAVEPRRLARRYLVDDLPYAARLLAASAVRRMARSGRGAVTSASSAAGAASGPADRRAA